MEWRRVMNSEESRKAVDLVRAIWRLRKVDWHGQQFIEGCSPGETHFLYVLRRMMQNMPEGLKVSDISDRLHVANPTVTQMANVLEARGLLERRPDPQDRRVVRLRLTDTGTKMTQTAEEAMLANVQEFIDHLGTERSQLFIELLDEVHQYFAKKKELNDEVGK